MVRAHQPTKRAGEITGALHRSPTHTYTGRWSKYGLNQPAVCCGSGAGSQSLSIWNPNFGAGTSHEVTATALHEAPQTNVPVGYVK